MSHESHHTRRGVRVTLHPALVCVLHVTVKGAIYKCSGGGVFLLFYFCSFVLVGEGRQCWRGAVEDNQAEQRKERGKMILFSASSLAYSLCKLVWQMYDLGIFPE